MDCFDRFKRKMELSGGSLRNEHIQDSKMLLNETFADDSSFALGIYMWKLGKIGKDAYKDCDTLKIRFYDRKFSTANGGNMKFQTLEGTPIVVGDMIYDSINDIYWICTESFIIDEIHYQGKFTQCNWILKWQDKTGRILEYPCQDINATQYNSGERSNQQFAIGSAQHTLTLPCDENTVVLSTPQRFYLDKNEIEPTSYIVTQNDTTSYNYGEKGLVKVMVVQHPADKDKDRPDLGICDYVDVDLDDTQDSEQDKDENTISAKIVYDKKVIKSGGDSQIFKALFYDNNGKEVTDVIPLWNIVCDFKNELEIKESGNEIEIKIDNDNCIDESFRLILSDTYCTTSTYIIVAIDSLL